ncbi:MAG: GNAT family N-acetyltransferase [Chloroflexia bacterium]|nr:GNAT family N-acetyltransferase [Chloroflexia bacterium]
MPPNPDIRAYAAGDEAGVLAVWNEAMWADPITATAWRSRYLLDPNFAAHDCPVAVDPVTGQVVGFALGFTEPASPGETWVVAFGVAASHRRQGIGAALMTWLEARWRAAGIARIQFGPYIPGYVTPGIDVADYADAVRFLHAIGATELSRPLSMKVSLTGYRAAPITGEQEAALARAGVIVRPAAPTDILPLLQFLDTHFSAWGDDARPVLRDLFAGDPRPVTMFVAEDAEDNGAIIGYAQTRNERFGPFGVDEAYRGRGVGAVLLSKTLLAMRANGFHCAWFLWTSDRAARLYQQHGFAEVRRFALMAKTIDHDGSPPEESVS